MTLTEFTQGALRTAEQRAFDHQYLLPGLIGEVGELFAEFAKEHWHETDRGDTKVDELGDVAWLTAILLHTLNVSEDDITHSTWTMPLPDDVDGMLELLLSRAAAVYLSDEGALRKRAVVLWRFLEDAAPVLTGQPLQAALRANQAKLQSRAEAGELKTHS